MRLLLILNLITMWICIGYLLVRPHWTRLEFRWSQTFFGKVTYGFYILLWELPQGVTPNNGRSIFRFDWRNPDSIPDKPYIKGMPRFALPRALGFMQRIKPETKTA